MKKYLLTIILGLVGFLGFTQSQQANYIKYNETVYDDGTVSVEIHYKLYHDICNLTGEKNKFKFKIKGDLLNYSHFYTHKIKYTDCNGRNQQKTNKVQIGGKGASLGYIKNQNYVFKGELTNSKLNSEKSKWINLYTSKDGLNIDIQFLISKGDICSDHNKSNSYQYKVTGQPYSNPKHFKWDLPFTDCNGINQIESKRLLIGGKKSKTGTINSIDNIFRGVLNIDKFKKDTYLNKVNRAISEGNFKLAYENLSIININLSQTVIDSLKIIINKKAYKFYLDKVNSSASNLTKVKQICIEAINVLENKNDNLFFKNKLVSINKIEKEQNQIIIINDIDYYIKSDKIENAIRVYEQNIDNYSIAFKKEEILEKGEYSASYYESKNNFSIAIKFNQILYNFTDNIEYSTKISNLKIKEEKYRIELVINNFNKNINKAKKESNIRNWELVYDLANNNKDIISKKEREKAINKIYPLWKIDIKKDIKKVKKIAKTREYPKAYSELNLLKIKINKYKNKSYKSENVNKTSKTISKFQRKIERKKQKYPLNNYKYQKRKYGRRTLRIGTTYDAFIFNNSYVLNTKHDIFKSDLLNYTTNFNFSKISFNMCYSRFGVYWGNYNKTGSYSKFNLGGYLKLINSLYFKFGYLYNTQNNSKPISLESNMPFSTGISLMTPIIHFELSYNMLQKSYAIGLGINIYFRKSNSHSSKYKSEYRHWKKKIKDYK